MKPFKMSEPCKPISALRDLCSTDKERCSTLGYADMTPWPISSHVLPVQMMVVHFIPLCGDIGVSELKIAMEVSMHVHVKKTLQMMVVLFIPIIWLGILVLIS